MSRSYKKTPIMGVTGSGSRKDWLRQENRRYRAYVRDKMRNRRYDEIQGFCGRFGNEWLSPRDGTYWFGEYKYNPCYKDFVCRMYGHTTIKTCTKHSHWYDCVGAYKEYMRK